MKKDLREKDDAVSPVIALMLILAILATCLAVYTTTYVPGLKQQDEITHSGDVKLTFERFASDIDNLVAQGKPAVYTEVLELGGGDVPLSPTKSSGTIEIEETIIGTYKIGGVTKNLTGIIVSYLPSFTAWEKQGYLYKNGVVWITKDEKKTPASPTLYTIQNGTDHENKTVDAWYKPSSGILTIPLFSTEGISEITGTSTVKLRLNATVTEETATAVTITMPGKTETYSGVTIRYLNIGVSVE
ncbi:MAG: hypothetical protein IJE95_04920 [Methanocorpusculum sp.]|nr:hypothetical protein [Methanocorpusculum sp.]